MDYGQDILVKLVQMYERRRGYVKALTKVVRLETGKEYPEYVDRHNYEAYAEINAAIERILSKGFIKAKGNDAGQYLKLDLNLEAVDEIYAVLGRVSIPKQCRQVQQVLVPYLASDKAIIKKIAEDFTQLLANYEKLPHDLKYDAVRVKQILQLLDAILALQEETYIRNFSTAVLKDSKAFQNEYRKLAEALLYEYTELEAGVEREQILNYYNLYENPTYVLLKGAAEMRLAGGVLNLAAIPGGIALSQAALGSIEYIKVQAAKVITVENLTTYHDADEEDALHIYLGGYHNRAKQELLQGIYAQQPQCSFYHKGDLDVHGLLILENLKAKTGIPFVPLQMEAQLLRSFYAQGLYKELTAGDVRLLQGLRHTALAEYSELVDCMLELNCKAEQENFKALQLLQH